MSISNIQAHTLINFPDITAQPEVHSQIPQNKHFNDGKFNSTDYSSGDVSENINNMRLQVTIESNSIDVKFKDNKNLNIIDFLKPIINTDNSKDVNSISIGVEAQETSEDVKQETIEVISAYLKEFLGGDIELT